MNLPDYKRTYIELCTNVHDVYFHWCLYQQLYGNGMRVNMLNKTAPEYFVYTEMCHIFYIVSAISGLLDHATVAGKSTLSFESLIRDIKFKGICTCELEAKLEELRSCARNLRKDRNTKIAHNDRKVHTLRNHTLATSRRDILKTFKKMRSLMEAIEKLMPEKFKHDWNAHIHAGEVFRDLKAVLQRSLLYEKVTRI